MSKKLPSYLIMLIMLCSLFSAFFIREAKADLAPITLNVQLNDDYGQWAVVGDATVYSYPDYQGTGIDYIGATVHLTMWSFGELPPVFGFVSFTFGKEFTVIDSNMGATYGTYLWYYQNLLPVYGEGTRGSGNGYVWNWAYSATYYVMAQRNDYQATTTWLQLDGTATIDDPSFGNIHSDHDWNYLDLGQPI